MGLQRDGISTENDVAAVFQNIEKPIVIGENLLFIGAAAPYLHGMADVGVQARKSTGSPQICFVIIPIGFAD